MIVIDASVAVKWLVPEAGEAEAKRWLNGNERLVAPSIVRIEVANAVVRKYRNDGLPEAAAKTACELWDALLENHVLQLVPIEELYQSALALAFEARHTVPDCLYLALAKRDGFTLVTADRPMYDRGLAVHDQLQWLFASAVPH